MAKKKAVKKGAKKATKKKSLPLTRADVDQLEETFTRQKAERTQAARAAGKLKKSYVVPSDCLPVFDYVLDRLQAGAAGETVADMKADFEACSAFLEGLPDDACYGEIDILVDGSWNKKTEKEIQDNYV